jgi:hypothetical protein
VWSKAGRSVECMHAVGDILKKISVNWVIKFTCCIIISVFSFIDLSGV